MKSRNPLEESAAGLMVGLDRLNEAELLERRSSLEKISAKLAARKESGKLEPGDRVLLENLDEDYLWKINSALRMARRKGA